MGVSRGGDGRKPTELGDAVLGEAMLDITYDLIRTILYAKTDEDELDDNW